MPYIALLSNIDIVLSCAKQTPLLLPHWFSQYFYTPNAPLVNLAYILYTLYAKKAVFRICVKNHCIHSGIALYLQGEKLESGRGSNY